jgi:hypothetical protein
LTIYIKKTQPFKRGRPLTYPHGHGLQNEQFSENRMVEIKKIKILETKKYQKVVKN